MLIVKYYFLHSHGALCTDPFACQISRCVTFLWACHLKHRREITCKIIWLQMS